MDVCSTVDYCVYFDLHGPAMSRRDLFRLPKRVLFYAQSIYDFLTLLERNPWYRYHQPVCWVYIWYAGDWSAKKVLL
jgi:hypothetical protein